ncbi:MAG: hypothetical protein DRQ62_06200 [Gammaproteobacteria bacterium]|nr:MAG: hypothetical protein DRQ62_06200 [Gammaproteobacteria bacterium]
MAVRSRLEQQQHVRDKIQTTQLVKRLMLHSLADGDIMTTSQVHAARVLLNKVIPDMKEVEHSGSIVAQMNHLMGFDKPDA